MQDLLQRLETLGLIPVVAMESAGQADRLADALIKGGLPCAEVTLRTEDALGVIERLAGRGDLLVGAGTVHSARQAEQALKAGATFIVSPGFNPRTVGWCLENRVPIFPGVSTPTDLESALEFELAVVKFFPAEALGGVGTLKALSAPYGEIRFIPTGGIGPGNVRAYRSLSCVVACGGSWMVGAELLKAGRFDEVERLSREAVGLAAR